MRHVPAAARYLSGRVLTRALAAAAEHNDLQFWTELLMLPQCVLGLPPRGGRRHRRAAAAYTTDRLQRWLEGERASLWHDRHCPPVRQRSGGISPKQRRELATALAREGFDRKACNALVAGGLCPETSETLTALQALHPGQPAPRVVLEDLPLAFEVVPDFVCQGSSWLPR